MAFSGKVSYPSNEIISMDDHRPHVVIPTPLAHHVYPVAYFQSVAEGKPVDPIPPDVLAVIIQEWINSLPEPQQA